jgi:hypothetical protein
MPLARTKQVLPAQVAIVTGTGSGDINQGSPQAAAISDARLSGVNVVFLHDETEGYAPSLPGNVEILATAEAKSEDKANAAFYPGQIVTAISHGMTISQPTSSEMGGAAAGVLLAAIGRADESSDEPTPVEVYVLSASIRIQDGKRDDADDLLKTEMAKSLNARLKADYSAAVADGSALPEFVAADIDNDKATELKSFKTKSGATYYVNPGNEALPMGAVSQYHSKKSAPVVDNTSQAAFAAVLITETTERTESSGCGKKPSARWVHSLP